MNRKIAIPGNNDTYAVRHLLGRTGIGGIWNGTRKVWLFPEHLAATARYIITYRQMPPAPVMQPPATPAPATDHWQGFQLPGTTPAIAPVAQESPETTPQPTAESQGFKVSGFYNTVPSGAIPLSSLMPTRNATPAPRRVTRTGKTVDDLLASAFPD